MRVGFATVSWERDEWQGIAPEGGAKKTMRAAYNALVLGLRRP